MKKYLTNSILALFLVLTNIGISANVMVYAANSICDNSNISDSIKAASGCSKQGDKLPNTIINILNVIIGLAGLVAVVFIIVGGFQYMTSTGDPGKVKKAKDTIMYAVVGLVVCSLAAAIVNFVIKAATSEPDKPASSYTTKKECKDNSHNWDEKTKTCS